jgi:hypothetical protein
MELSARAGAHRFSWDLHYNPIGTDEGPPEDDDAAQGAVPRHTYPAVNAPWAPAGTYTVRLTVDGKSYTQPLSLRLDPRVRTPSAGLTQLATLSREMYDGAVAAHAAYNQARALSTQLDKVSGPDVAALKAKVDSLAPSQAGGRRGGRGFGGGRGRGGGPPAPPTLETASSAMIAAAMAMQSADVTPTAGAIAACASARQTATDVMRRWTALKTTELGALNAKRKTAGQPTITPPGA